MSDTNQLNVAIINNIYSRQCFLHGMDKNSACYSSVETESLMGMKWEHKGHYDLDKRNLQAVTERPLHVVSSSALLIAQIF